MRNERFAAIPALLRTMTVCILATLMLFAPKPAHAGRLGADVIALFPKEVGEFAYADLKKARRVSL